MDSNKGHLLVLKTFLTELKENHTWRSENKGSLPQVKLSKQNSMSKPKFVSSS